MAASSHSTWITERETAVHVTLSAKLKMPNGAAQRARADVEGLRHESAIIDGDPNGFGADRHEFIVARENPDWGLIRERPDNDHQIISARRNCAMRRSGLL